MSRPHNFPNLGGDGTKKKQFPLTIEDGKKRDSRVFEKTFFSFFKLILISFLFG